MSYDVLMAVNGLKHLAETTSEKAKRFCCCCCLFVLVCVWVCGCVGGCVCLLLYNLPVLKVNEPFTSLAQSRPLLPKVLK